MGNVYKTLFENQLIDEWLDLVYRRYILTQPGITVEYYNIDTQNSVYDETLKATYNRPGNIDLTGVKFNKYDNVMLIFSTRTQMPENDSQNYGFNSYDSQFQVFLPTIFNIEPQPNDYIIFKPSPQNELRSYIVTGIESATIGSQPNHTGWYLTLKPYYIDEETLDSLVLSEQVFNPIEMIFQSVDDYNNEMMYFIALTNIIQKLQNKFNNVLLTYVDEYNNSYKPFETLLTIARQKLPDQYKSNMILPYTTTYDETFLTTFENFLSTYDTSLLNLQNITVRDDVKNASAVDEIYILSQDPSLNTLELFILLYKLLKLGGYLDE